MWGRGIAAIAREASRSMISGRLRTVAQIALASLAVSVPMYLDARAAQSAIDDFLLFKNAGGFIWLVHGQASDGTIPTIVDRSVCESLQVLPGIEASGSIGSGEPATLLALPDQQLDVLVATSGIYRVMAALGEPGPLSHFLLGTQLQNDLQLVLRRNIVIADADRTIEVRATGASLGRIQPGFSTALLEPGAPVGLATHCVVAVEPAAPTVTGSLQAPFGRTDLTVRPALLGAELVDRSWLDFADRSVVNLWVILAAGYGLALAFVEWTRRSETAIYSIIGMRPAEVKLLRFLELLQVTLIGGLVGLAAGRVGTAGFSLSALAFGWTTGLMALLGTAVSVVVVSLITSTRNPLNKLKDR